MKKPPLYKRKVGGQLLTLRLVSTLMLALIVYLFNQGVNDYAIFACVLLLPVCTINLTKVTVYADTVLITTYYLFGFLIKTYNLNTKNILSMTSREDRLEVDDTAGYDTDSFFDFITLLSPTKTIVTNITEFTYNDDKGEIQSVKVKLKAKEYKLIWDTLNGQMH